MGSFGALSGLFTVFIIIVVILSILTPFFILRIRNELISINKKMEILVNIAQQINAPNKNEPAATKCLKTESGNVIKICSYCGRKNRDEDLICSECGRTLL